MSIIYQKEIKSVVEREKNSNKSDSGERNRLGVMRERMFSRMGDW